MRPWHDAQIGLARCSSICWRSDIDVPDLGFIQHGTPGGGGGTGAFRRFSSTHLPRSTTEVRVEYDDTVSTLPCVSTPPRGVPVRSTLRNSGPCTPGMP